MTRHNLILVTGGARSGKSRRALDLAQPCAHKAFLATAEPVDAEMRERIARHRAERGDSFLTVEAPIDLAGAVLSLSASVEVAIVDCLTIWLGNLMHRSARNDRGYREIDAFVDQLENPRCDLIIVSNEVGMGIVPDTPLSRRFRDLAGGLNQTVARLADRVELMVAGVPMTVLRGNRKIGTLETAIDAIVPLDATLERGVRDRLDSLTKPPGSLGALEELATRYCLITGTLEPVLGGKKIFTFAGDHGVAAEGVSAYPQAVTPQMIRNMLAGGAAVNVLAAHVGAELSVIDIGVDDPLEGAAGLHRAKIRPGTGNIAKGPAMEVGEAIRAVETGIGLAAPAAAAGITLIGGGDMGIANTTSASALLAALLPAPAIDVTGHGTGIDEATLARKTAIVEQALAVNRDRLNGPLNALAALGGFEIAGIAGLFLGAAAHRVPAVVDGFIASAGALAACRLCPAVKEYLYFSHCSAEAGHRRFFERFGATPILDLNMRLGEGTGVALAMSLIEAAVKLYNDMATFDSAGASGGAR